MSYILFAVAPEVIEMAGSTTKSDIWYDPVFAVGCMRCSIMSIFLFTVILVSLNFPLHILYDFLPIFYFTQECWVYCDRAAPGQPALLRFAAAACHVSHCAGKLNIYIFDTYSQ